MSSPDFSWKYEDGKIVIAAAYAAEEASASLNVSISLLAILQEAAAKTENKYDDEVVAFLKDILEKQG